MKTRLPLVLFTIILLSSTAVLAQTTGVITGVIKDSTGGIVPGVSVTAERPATGEARTVVSNDNGIYRLSNLSPGDYTVTAELTGFKTFVDQDVRVSVGDLVTIDITMEVGDITQTVTVSSQAAIVQKDEGRTSHLVQAEEIKDLPLNGRNAYQLAQIAPGVTPTFGRVSQSAGGANGDTFQANGQRHRANNYLMDGTDNNYVGIAGIPTVTPQVDIIEEFRVNTNNFSAEYGRNAGAIINVLTKSGTNELHGSVYWYHRNDALDAREFFARASGPDDDSGGKAPLRQHTFGFTAGGPILQDKLFAFGGYEGFREASGESTRITAETAELVAFVNSTRPNSIAAQLFSRFPLGRTIDCSDPIFTCEDIGSPAAGVFNVGAPDGIPDLGDVSFASTQISRFNQWNLRIDNNPSDVDSIYGRFTRQLTPSAVDTFRPGVDSDGEVTEQSLTFSWTRIINSAVVHELRLGWNEREPNFDVQQGTFDVPTIRINGFRGPVGGGGFGANSNIPQFFARHTYQLSDQLAWTRGNHSFKFGGEFRHGQENSDFQASTRGVYNFDNVLDFIDDEPEDQTNLIDPVTGNPIGTPRNFRVNEWALYIQDDWKVSPQLTLNLGLRYENFRPPYEARGIQSQIRLGQGSTLGERYANSFVGIYSLDEDIYEPDNNNFAPRFGFAYDPTGSGRTAIRGGWGISYNRIFMNITSNIKFNPPFAQSVTADQDNGLPILYSIPTQIDPSLVSGFEPPRFNPNFLDPDLGTSYVHSFFLGVQHELAQGWVLEANYVSTLGRKLYQQEHFNRFTGDLLDGSADGLNPAWGVGTDDFLTGSINQSYHSGQFRIQKRFSGGVGFRANYTWAKNIDSDTDVFGADSDDSGSMIIECRRCDRGLSSIHVGNRFTATWVWELPWGQTADSWAVRNILGNWQVNGLLALQDGTPTTVVADGSSFTGRGDFNGDGVTDDRPMVGSLTADDIDPRDALSTALFGGRAGVHNIFPKPAPGTNGNLGRNTFFYHGFATVDLSLFKNIPMPWFAGETATWQFRAEFFNLFNRVNPDVWEENLTSGSFGETSSVFDAREIQFALKFLF